MPSEKQKAITDASLKKITGDMLVWKQCCKNKRVCYQLGSQRELLFFLSKEGSEQKNVYGLLAGRAEMSSWAYLSLGPTNYPGYPGPAQLNMGLKISS